MERFKICRIITLSLFLFFFLFFFFSFFFSSFSSSLSPNCSSSNLFHSSRHDSTVHHQAVDDLSFLLCRFVHAQNAHPHVPDRLCGRWIFLTGTSLSDGAPSFPRASRYPLSDRSPWRPPSCVSSRGEGTG